MTLFYFIPLVYLSAKNTFAARYQAEEIKKKGSHKSEQEL